MNSKETIVRNCIEAKRCEADSYQNPGCYNAAFCRGYVEGASETLSTMLSPAENSKEDEENGCHGEAIPYTTDDCCDNGIFDDYPLYVAGVQEKDNFNAFHNFYAIFSCNLVP